MLHLYCMPSLKMWESIRLLLSSKDIVSVGYKVHQQETSMQFEKAIGRIQKS